MILGCSIVYLFGDFFYLVLFWLIWVVVGLILQIKFLIHFYVVLYLFRLNLVWL